MKKLPPSRIEIYFKDFEIFEKALNQEKYTKDKIYSLHEPQTACIAKGKAGKKYEFGTKVSIARGRKTGIVTAVTRFAGNPHDSKTLEETLAQCERVRTMAGGNRPKIVAADRGYKGATMVGETKIIMPSTGKGKTRYQQRTESHRCKDRAAIEPCISHLKHNHALGRNFLKGVAGDIHNALLAGIGYNLKLKLNKIKEQIVLWFNFLLSFYRSFFMMRSWKVGF